MLLLQTFASLHHEVFRNPNSSEFSKKDLLLPENFSKTSRNREHTFHLLPNPPRPPTPPGQPRPPPNPPRPLVPTPPPSPPTHSTDGHFKHTLLAGREAYRLTPYTLPYPPRPTTPPGGPGRPGPHYPRPNVPTPPPSPRRSVDIVLLSNDAMGGFILRLLIIARMLLMGLCEEDPPVQVDSCSPRTGSRPQLVSASTSSTETISTVRA
ncbi:hypothetical protein F4780DRAFT_116997 [Xylariomycetidae sp. FL0641]|nr:hypothetical protein F4780DRAFT_116997 [Xylariomycetidae sp. FL0641]